MSVKSKANKELIKQSQQSNILNKPYLYFLLSIFSTIYVSSYEAEGEFSIVALTAKVLPIIFLIVYVISLRSSSTIVHNCNGDKVKGGVKKERIAAAKIDDQRLLRCVKNGLFFSMIGDALLLVRVGSNTCFVLGTISFLIAHIWYGQGMVHQNSRLWVGILLYLSSAGIAVAILRNATLLYQFLFSIYGAILTTSLWRAADRFMVKDGKSNNQKMATCLGFGVFLLSDCWIGVTTFLTGELTYSSAAFILLTYYVAQGLIIFSLC